jgi:hypothetical protein
MLSGQNYVEWSTLCRVVDILAGDTLAGDIFKLSTLILPEDVVHNSKGCVLQQSAIKLQIKK